MDTITTVMIFAGIGGEMYEHIIVTIISCVIVYEIIITLADGSKNEFKIIKCTSTELNWRD